MLTNIKIACLFIVFPLAGCCHPSVTAVPLSAWNRDEPHGIPFYLPKPILIVAKNFRNMEESKVGLTDSAPIPNYFDDQAKYGDVNARTSWTPARASASGQAPAATSGTQTTPTGQGALATNSAPRVFSEHGAPVRPDSVPSDGLTPDTFYTYQIVFIPDMTQKYGLRVKGGVGEIRAALNLVNGWMFTGLGPYYMKDSSTAQDTLATGIAANLAASGVADVLTSLQGLKGAGKASEGGDANRAVAPAAIHEVHEQIVNLGLRPQPLRLEGYAEIHVYEPTVTCDGRMEWREITDKAFYRDYFGTIQPRLTRSIQPGTVSTATSQEGGDKMSAAKKQEGGDAPVAPSTPGTNQSVNLNLCPPPVPCAHPFLSKPTCLERLCDKICPPKSRIQTLETDAELNDQQLQRVLNQPLLLDLPFKPTPPATVNPLGTTPLPPGVTAPPK